MSEEKESLVPKGPSSVLPAFLERIVRHRRVAMLGPATSPLAYELLERGARVVHVLDGDPARVSEATAKAAGVVGAKPSFGVANDDLGVRPGSFDVVFVSDLSSLPDPPKVVRQARDLVPANGVAVFASPNPETTTFLYPPTTGHEEALGYYELFDLVSAQWSDVRMLGQAPFIGYSIVDFATDAGDVAVDTSVLEGPESPEWYIAIGSDRELDLDDYAVIALPVGDLANAIQSDEPLTVRRVQIQKDQLEIALAEAEGRLQALFQEKQVLSEREQQAVLEAGARTKTVDELSMRVAELEKQLDGAKTQPPPPLPAPDVELQAEFAKERLRISRLRESLDDALKNRDRAERMVSGLREELRESKEEAARAAEPWQAKVRDLELRQAELEDALVKATEPPTLRSKHQQNAERLEQAERERAAAQVRVLALESEVEQMRQKVGRLETKNVEIMRSLEATSGSGEGERTAEVAHFEEKLREQAAVLSRLMADLRESERTGKELLLELESARETRGGFQPSGSGEELARLRADLSAREWRLAQVERELETSSRAESSKTSKEATLEKALVLAHRELAEARRGSTDMSSAVEHSVLLAQAEASLKTKPDDGAGRV